jgi:hypothetical protein
VSDSGVGIPVPDGNWLEPWIDEGGWELDDKDRQNCEILLQHATLTGLERSDLEDFLECEDLDANDRERLQELVNSHLATIHAYQ